MFNIKIYLDDNLDSYLLKGILRSNKFEVISPREIGMSGNSDDNHLKCAKVKGAIVLTQDQQFPTQNPHIQHKGILIVYGSSNPKKDMTPIKIVRALKNIKMQNLNLDNQILPLNSFLY